MRLRIIKSVKLLIPSYVVLVTRSSNMDSCLASEHKCRRTKKMKVDDTCEAELTGG